MRSFHSIRRLGVLILLSGTAAVQPLAAQNGDTAGMKPDQMKHDTMMKDDKMMGHEMMGSHGPFVGKNGHETSGSYEIVMADGKQWVKLGQDFSLDKAPDPYVVISPSDKGGDKQALNLGVLRSLKGTQAYEIPAGTDLGRFKNVIIYCKKYNATLGISTLVAPGAMMHN
jgi:hypothetical protein